MYFNLKVEMNFTSVNKLFEASFKNNWDRPAISNCQDAFIKYIESTLPEVNKDLPNYARLRKIEVMSEAFERTPKKSIKRYLYQRN